MNGNNMICNSCETEMRITADHSHIRNIGNNDTPPYADGWLVWKCPDCGYWEIQTL